MDGDPRQLIQRALEKLQQETDEHRALSDKQTRENADLRRTERRLREQLRASQAKIAEKDEELKKKNKKLEQREQELESLRASSEKARAELARILDGLGRAADAGNSSGQRQTDIETDIKPEEDNQAKVPEKSQEAADAGPSFRKRKLEHDLDSSDDELHDLPRFFVKTSGETVTNLGPATETIGIRNRMKSRQNSKGTAAGGSSTKPKTGGKYSSKAAPKPLKRARPPVHPGDALWNQEELKVYTGTLLQMSSARTG